MKTDGGGWTLVARINGADAQNLLYDVRTAGQTVGDVADFSLVAGGDVLSPADTAATADELMFLDATTPCGEQNRLAQTTAIMGNKSLAAYLAGIAPLNVGAPERRPSARSQCVDRGLHQYGVHPAVLWHRQQVPGEKISASTSR